MRFDDGAANRQAHSDTIGLRAVECFENPIQLADRYPTACIRDTHDYTLFPNRTSDGDALCPWRSCHRLSAVHDQVENNLLQLRPVSYDFDRQFPHIEADLYLTPLQFARQKTQHLM